MLPRTFSKIVKHALHLNLMPLDLSAGGLPVSELGLVFVIAVIIVVVWAGRA